MISFVVEGVPVPKARARVVMRGKFPSAYTPKPSKDYEKLVAVAAKSRMNNRGLLVTDKACKVELDFTMPIPASTSKKKTELMQEGSIRHAKKPDLDNLIKQICDSLNGVVWKDDSQVVELIATKKYCGKGVTPGLYVIVTIVE
jgi:Holliday junction resolvase RusA-like endonuclease